MIDEKRLIKFLKNNKRQLFSAGELAALFNTTNSKMCIKLKSLSKYNILEEREIDKKLANKIYGPDHRRRVTLYCYKE